MSLSGVKELLEEAKQKNRAVGSFSVANMEMIIGSVKAAEEMNTPIILQRAEKRLSSNSPLELMAPMMLEAAKKSKVKIAVHFDHGETETKIVEAIEYGFTSVMYDGSKESIEENIKKIKKIKKAYPKIDVEAELGLLGVDEEGKKEESWNYTNPEDAAYFVKAAKPDSLAISIGNTHGVYKGPVHLRFDILKEIQSLLDVPLVFHGGSGVSEEDFKRCMDFGIRKINIATSNFQSYVKAVNNYLINGEKDYFSLENQIVEAIRWNVKKHIQIFNNGSEI